MSVAKRAQVQSGQSANREQEDERNRVTHRRRQTDRPLVHRGHPVEHLDRRRNRNRKRQRAEDDRRQRTHPGREHVVAPDQEAQQGDRDRRVSDEAISEDPLVAVDADQVADDAEGRQNHDVHSRVAVEPEEVLERHRVAVELGIENPDVHRPFGDQQQQRDSEHGSRQHLNDAGRVGRPKKQRHAKPSHPRRSHRVDRDDEVQTGEDRTEAEDERPRSSPGSRTYQWSCCKACRTSNRYPRPLAHNAQMKKIAPNTHR